ncbi:MAG: polysaccharide biosynthesis protein [Hymenobacter sp.]|nr:MAG: polysaccharide biosynthesis protein [Hymenobacter sp.]
MKTLVSRLPITFSYAKGREWGKLIAITGGAQALVQLSSVIGGILVIRLLSTHEYALYTLANTMLGTMVMLADNGISNGVMAEAGKVWQNQAQLGAVLATGLHLRKKFALYTLLVTIPILGYLLWQHQAVWYAILLIVLAIIPAFAASLSDTLLEVAPKLHQDINPLQRNQLEVNAGRLLLNAMLLFVFPFTFVALLANSIPRIYGNYKLRKLSARYVHTDTVISTAVEREVLKGVKRTLPVVIYHCVSGQISIWLISLFGTTNSIAQIGALGRLTMAFTLFSSIFSTLAVPRFSRMHNNKTSLLKGFISIQIIALIIGCVISIIVWLFSDKILLILGKKYSNLNYELVLVSIISCVGLLEGLCSQLVLSRGWFFNPYALIIVNFASTIVFILFSPAFSIANILYYNMFTGIIFYLLGLVLGLVKINQIR